MSYAPPSFVDACSHFVRKLVGAAYNMPSGSVRPAGQPYPVGNEVSEFATVKIMAGPSADFGAQSVEYVNDPTTGSTKVNENIENVYRFTASIQFFRHATPTSDGAGLAQFGMSAVDKAARLDTILASSPMMALMEQMGLGLEDSSEPRDVGAFVNSSTWEDRGSVDMTFVIVNREQFLIESFGSIKSAEVRYQSPGKTSPDVYPIEVTP
jgi:hypothetical protein